MSAVPELTPAAHDQLERVQRAAALMAARMSSDRMGQAALMSSFSNPAELTQALVTIVEQLAMDLGSIDGRTPAKVLSDVAVLAARGLAAADARDHPPST